MLNWNCDKAKADILKWLKGNPPKENPAMQCTPWEAVCMVGDAIVLTGKETEEELDPDLVVDAFLQDGGFIDACCGLLGLDVAWGLRLVKAEATTDLYPAFEVGEALQLQFHCTDMAQVPLTQQYDCEGRCKADL